jgi:hypothetical protein
MAIGAIGYMVVGVDSSGNTAGTLSNSPAGGCQDFLPFISEGFAITKDDVPDVSISGNWDQDGVFNGIQRVEGNVTILAHPIQMGWFFQSAFDTSTTAPCGSLSNGITGATSAATTAAKEHLFITKNVQFQTGSGSDLPTLSFEIFRGPQGVGSAFAFYNCAANNLEVIFEAGQPGRVSADFIGRDHGRVPRRSTLTFGNPEAYIWCAASVQIGGQFSPILESLTTRVENALQGIARLDGRCRGYDLIKRTDFRRVFMSGTIGFNNDIQYDNFISGSETSIRVTCKGDNAIAGTNKNTFLIDAPRMRYNAFPVAVGGPGRVVTNFTAQCLYDNTSNYALQIFLVNTRISGYWVNSNG